jgi:hypothetical protein
MQCPRCGLHNAPGVAACARCGLPVNVGPYPPRPTSPPTAAPPPAAQRPVPPYSAAAPAGRFGPSSEPAGPAPAQRPAGSGLARGLILLALLAALGYAAWALTARRTIFGDFAAGRAVTLSDARTSDHIDNVAIIVAGGLCGLAFLAWLLRRSTGRTRGGAPDTVGLVLTVLGGVTIGVGLLLLETVTDAGGQHAQGNRAALGTAVSGVGFVVVAVGLAVGFAVARRPRDPVAAAARREPPPLPGR